MTCEHSLPPDQSPLEFVHFFNFLFPYQNFDILYSPPPARTLKLKVSASVSICNLL